MLQLTYAYRLACCGSGLEVKATTGMALSSIPGSILADEDPESGIETCVVEQGRCETDDEGVVG